MAKANKLKGKLGQVQKVQQQFIVKIAIVLILIVTAVVLILTNHNFMRENKRMIKFIAHQDVFKKTLESLEASEAQFAPLFIKIESGADLEKIKNDHINQLLNLVNLSELTVDSYRSEIEKKDGFVIFKTNIVLTGDFIQTIRFFAQMRNDAPQTYVSGYDIQLHQEKFVRIGLIVEIVGLEM